MLHPVSVGVGERVCYGLMLFLYRLNLLLLLLLVLPASLLCSPLAPRRNAIESTTWRYTGISWGLFLLVRCRYLAAVDACHALATCSQILDELIYFIGHQYGNI
jgi:hypothetical protein